MEVTPDWLISKKWQETGCNLQVGDIILVHDKSQIKGHYIMAIVEAVSVGKGGLVRLCKVGYGVPRERKDIHHCKGR